MKVLEGPAQWTMQVTCRQRHCGTKLEIEATDVKWGSFGVNWGGDSPELGFYVECPSCAHPIRIDESDIPRTVYDKGAAWFQRS